jgi:hypothetical protein
MLRCSDDFPNSSADSVSLVSLPQSAWRCEAESTLFRTVCHGEQYKRTGNSFRSFSIDSLKFGRVPQPTFLWERTFATSNNVQPLIAYAPCPVWLSARVVPRGSSFFRGIHGLLRAFDCWVGTFSVASIVLLENSKPNIKRKQKSAVLAPLHWSI